MCRCPEAVASLPRLHHLCHIITYVSCYFTPFFEQQQLLLQVRTHFPLFVSPSQTKPSLYLLRAILTSDRPCSSLHSDGKKAVVQTHSTIKILTWNLWGLDFLCQLNLNLRVVLRCIIKKHLEKGNWAQGAGEGISKVWQTSTCHQQGCKQQLSGGCKQ